MDPYRETIATKIHSAVFVKGIVGTDPIIYDERPQIAFVGRSNVGKSSVINKLLSKHGLAKSSSTPGKTSEINFFLVNNEFYVVDLPGYGYAKVGEKEMEKFRKRILWYITESEVKPRFVVIIIDARRSVTELDEDMVDVLLQWNQKPVIIVNKSDKLNQREQNEILKDVKTKLEKLGGTTIPTFLFSAKTGKGKEKIMEFLF